MTMYTFSYAIYQVYTQINYNSYIKNAYLSIK